MKIKEFRKFLANKGIDLALFYNTKIGVDPNFFYLTGFKGAGAAVVSQKPFLLVPKMEIERARKGNIKNVYAFDKKKFFESIFGIIKKKKIKPKRIGIDKNTFTLNSYNALKKHYRGKTTDISAYCLKLRSTKTPKETVYIKKSCSSADRILQKCINNFNEFKTESDAAAFLEYEARKNGLELSFPPIVASGKNASMPHYEPGNAKLNKGFCVIDFGVKYRGYCSDITRTIYIGKPSSEEKNIYNNLLAIQKNTIELVKENKKCSKLYDFVIKSLKKDAKYFTHGLGHGIGVEIHELPNLTSNSRDRIKNNMAFTVEPGIYIPKKFGIRIEDSILFSNKINILTKTAKELIIIRKKTEKKRT